jgi:putative spermidine/putrescine transport system permease protein
MERGLRYLWALLLALLYGFLLLPLVVVVLASVSGGQVLRFPPEGFSLKWYARFFSDETFISALLLSLRLALVSAFVVSILAVTAALFYRRLSARWRGPFRALVLLPLLLPEILTAIGLLFFLYRLGLGSSMFGLQVSHIVVTLPFSFLAVTAALQQVDPTLEEASNSLGAGALETFARVVLPMLRPGLFTGALFAFIVSFDMFTMSFLLKPVGGNTLPLALFDYLKYDFDPTAAAAATVSVAFALVVVLLVERTVGLRRAF